MPSTQPIKLGLIGTGGRLRGIVHRLLREAPAGTIEVVAAYDPEPKSLLALEDDCGRGIERLPSEAAFLRDDFLAFT
jgi:predicted dehydrogenase